MTLPACSGPRTGRNVGPEATHASGWWLRAPPWYFAVPCVVAAMPSQAEAAAGAAEPTSLVAILAGGLAFLALVVLVVGAIALLRRSRHAANEAQRLNALLDGLDEGVAVCSGMQAVSVNTSLCRLIGIELEDAQHLMISSFIADADVIDRLLGDGELRLDTDVTSRTGAIIAVEIAARSIPHGEGTARLLEFRDVGERKHTQERVSFLAHHDPLTSLPNREMMRMRLSEAVEKAAAAGKCCAVIWIDLDRFKDINDIHGHAVGDRILRVAAEKLKFEMPAHTLIARLGGDEFVVLCEDINDAAEARLIGQQLRRLLNRPMELGEKSMTVGASIGVAVFPEDATSAEDLLKNADLALYHAKAEGRGVAARHIERVG